MPRRRYRSRSSSYDIATRERMRTKMLVASLRLSSPVEVEMQGIDLLVNACEALKKGKVTVDELWPGSAYELSTLLENPSLLASARVELDRLKDTLKAISQLRFSLSAKMHFLERAVMPAVLHHGIGDLPDEVLMRILRLCHEEPNQTNDHMLDSFARQRNEGLRRLALVNRRFRDLIYELPHLWSDIFYLRKRHDVMNAATLERAKNAGLHIRQADSGLGTSGTEHTNSWTTLRLHGLQLVTHKRKGFIRLPKLESLKLELRHERPYAADGKDQSLIPHFLDSFHLPRVTELYLSQMYITDVTNGMVPISFMPQLTTLALKNYNFQSTRDLGLLASSLASASKLRHLTIDCDFSLKDSPDDEDFDLVHLDKLQSFSYGFSIVNSISSPYDDLPAGAIVDRTAAALQVMLSFSRSLVMPMLYSFSISAQSNFAIEDLLPVGRDYERLCRLTLEVPFETWKKSSESVFSNFSKLETLELNLAESTDQIYAFPGAVAPWAVNPWIHPAGPPLSPAGIMTPNGHIHVPPGPMLPTPPPGMHPGMVTQPQSPLIPAGVDTPLMTYEELPGAADIAKLRKFVYDGSLTGRSVVKDMCTILGQKEVKLESVELTMGGYSGDDHATASGRFFWDDRLFQNVKGPHYFEMYS